MDLKVLKDQAAFIDNELVKLTNSTNSFFDTIAKPKPPNHDLKNYLANLKKFGSNVQQELDFQQKNLLQSKKQVNDFREILNKLDNVVSGYENDNSVISNLSEQFGTSTRLPAFEKDFDSYYSTEENGNGNQNNIGSVNVNDLLNKPLPQL